MRLRGASAFEQIIFSDGSSTTADAFGQFEAAAQFVLDMLSGGFTPATSPEMLAASRTYYVRNDGRDANTGLQNTAAGAWQTIQFAVNYVAANIALPSGPQDATFQPPPVTVTVQVADGTYIETLVLPAVTGGLPILQGNLVTPGNVRIQSRAAALFAIGNNTQWLCKGFGLDDVFMAFNGYMVWATNGAKIYWDYIDLYFSNNTQTGFYADFGSFVGNPSFAHSLTVHGAVMNALAWAVDRSEIVVNLSALNLPDTPAVTTATAIAKGGGAKVSFHATTITGTATGKRYDASQLSLIDTQGGGANYIPGNVAGTADATTFGLYQ